MPITPKLLLNVRFAITLIVGVLLLCLIFAWRADRRDRAQLAADLASSRQALAQATTRQHDRDAQLQQALAAIANQQRKTAAPAQILRDLPKQIPLPAPITLQSPNSSTHDRRVDCGGLASPKARRAAGFTVAQPARNAPSGSDLLTDAGPGCGAEGLHTTRASQTGHAQASSSPDAVVPAADLKPLYDFALDCKACQAKLAAIQADLTDEKAKTAVLTRQRDEAVRLTKGGTVLRRIERATKWFVIGAAAGAIAAQAHH